MTAEWRAVSTPNQHSQIIDSEDQINSKFHTQLSRELTLMSMRVYVDIIEYHKHFHLTLTSALAVRIPKCKMHNCSLALNSALTCGIKV